MNGLATRPALATLLTEYRRNRAEQSLVEFMRQAWHVVEPSTPFSPGWHIDAIAEHLEAVTRGEIRNLVINVPPRHMKSLAVSVFWPVWEWITHPERRWLFASYAQSLSIRDSLKCRRLIESPWFQTRWGHVFQLTGDQNAKIKFENDHTGYRLATSVGGAVTGEGGDRVVVDDPHNVLEAPSDAIRRSTLTWWDESMSTRLNDPKTSARVIVMQRVHQDDLTGHVLERGGYELLRLPAEYDGRKYTTSIGWSDPREEPGELLWPERFGQDELTTLKRDLGSYGAAGQLQQSPSPAGGGLIKRQWWRFWHYEGHPLPSVTVDVGNGEIVECPVVPLPARFDEQIQSWDMTFKDTDGSDYVAGQVWAAERVNRFLLDRINARLNATATLQALRDMTAKHPGARTKLVEDTANGPAVITLLRNEIAGLVAVRPEGGKVARVMAVQPEIESGNVYLPHPAIAPWVWEFIEQTATFPYGAHDDEVDAMSQALTRLHRASLAELDPAIAAMLMDHTGR